MQLPSKLLLSAIYEEKVIDVWYVINTYENDMHIKIVDKSTTSGHYQFSVNLHELAYKCKEWACDNLWIMGSVKNKSKTYECFIEEILGFDAIEFEADTEPEAIFKACEYILTHKDRNVRI